MERSSRYTAVAIALHWAIAALIGFMIWLGWNMDGHEDRFQLHKSIGITILMLTVMRIVWRVMNPPPKHSDEMAPLEKTASHGVHMAFYALLVAMPLGGWLLVSISEFQVPTVLYGIVSWPKLPFASGIDSEAVYPIVEFLHSKGAWVIIGLLALHVLGALKHEFSSEEGVLKRMIPGLFGKTDAPRAPSKGFFAAFGSAVVLFALIAGSPVVASAMQGGETDLRATGMTGIAPNWDVDYEASKITFSGVHDGSEFSGTFDTWQAQVSFDPVNLGSSEVRVEVDLASAKTGTKLYDDSLKQAEWFDVKTNNQASVLLDNFAAATSGQGYTADATLRLKGTEATSRMIFTLEEEGDTATLDGQVIFTRKPLDLGQQSDPAGDWVDEEVTVRVTGKATRKGLMQ